MAETSRKMRMGETVMKASETLLSLSEPLCLSKDVNGNICAEYWHCEIKEGSFLIAHPGRGHDIESACEDYLNKIRGKTLVFDACTEKRREVRVLG